jgi:hypothetical protein
MIRGGFAGSEKPNTSASGIGTHCSNVMRWLMGLGFSFRLPQPPS